MQQLKYRYFLDLEKMKMNTVKSFNFNFKVMKCQDLTRMDMFVDKYFGNFLGS